MFNNKQQTPEQLAKEGVGILSIFKKAINDLKGLVTKAEVQKKDRQAVIAAEQANVKKLDGIIKEYTIARQNIENLLK